MKKIEIRDIKDILKKEEFKEFNLGLRSPSENPELNIDRSGIEITLKLFSDCTYDGDINNEYEIDEAIEKLQKYLKIIDYDIDFRRGDFSIKIEDTLFEESLKNMFDEDEENLYSTEETPYNIYFSVNKQDRSEFNSVLDSIDIGDCSIGFNAKTEYLQKREGFFSVGISCKDINVFSGVNFPEKTSIAYC